MLFNAFSRFTDPFEKKVYKTFLRISSKTHPIDVKSNLRSLIQADLIRTNLILEWKFKGYKNLKKSYRKKLYENVERLKEEFESYQATELPSDQSLKQREYLDLIRRFLHPTRCLRYQQGVSFHKLLRDPSVEKLIGDCNQITTLYIYLYSLKFPVQDLQLKVPEGHVCLHFRGEDLETTTGVWTTHEKFKRITNIEEIIPINLLDIPDYAEKKFDLSSLTKLKAAELAYKLSGERKLVEHNLRVAYHNCSIDYLKQQNYSTALRYAKASENQKLIKKIIYDQAVYWVDKGSFSRARKNFKKIKSDKGLKYADQQELNYYLKKIDHCKTVTDYRAKRSELKTIKRLAQKLGRKKLIQFCDEVLGKI